MEIIDKTLTGEDLLKKQQEKDRKERKRISELMKEAHKERIKAIESRPKTTALFGIESTNLTPPPPVRGLN